MVKSRNTQAGKFKKAAKEAEADESEAALGDALRRIVEPKPKAQTKGTQKKGGAKPA